MGVVLWVNLRDRASLNRFQNLQFSSQWFAEELFPLCFMLSFVDGYLVDTWLKSAFWDSPHPLPNPSSFLILLGFFFLFFSSLIIFCDEEKGFTFFLVDLDVLHEYFNKFLDSDYFLQFNNFWARTLVLP